MNWESVISFIRPELFILIVFLWCLGLFLKRAPWFNDEWSIPFILLGISLIVTVIYMAIVLGLGFNPEVIVTGIVQAVIIAALAVFGNELLKQGIVKRQADRQ
ncbi:MAG: phage holin family protein [Bacillota bacterium]|nr:phage holin family protein [Bacillota bacterium]